MKERSRKIVATNRKARYEYFIEEKLEAGLILKGTEVKSVRAGRVSLSDSFAAIEEGEAWLVNCHIAPYDQGNRYNVEEKRRRKLLLHSKEINRLFGQIHQKGKTLIPLSVYFSGSYVKVEIGLCRGKKTYDKREAIKERDEKRIMDRELSKNTR